MKWHVYLAGVRKPVCGETLRGGGPMLITVCCFQQSGGGDGVSCGPMSLWPAVRYRRRDCDAVPRWRTRRFDNEALPSESLGTVPAARNGLLYLSNPGNIKPIEIECRIAVQIQRRNGEVPCMLIEATALSPTEKDTERGQMPGFSRRIAQFAELRVIHPVPWASTETAGRSGESERGVADADDGQRQIMPRAEHGTE